MSAGTMTSHDPLVLLTRQHAQIDELFELVSQLRDPDALSELADVLSAHLSAENDLLYRALAPALSADVLEELRVEHLEIKRTVAHLVWFGVDDPEFVERLTHLGALLDGHVGYQEDHLFTGVATLPAGILTGIAAELEQRARDSHERALPLAS